MAYQQARNFCFQTFHGAKFSIAPSECGTTLISLSLSLSRFSRRKASHQINYRASFSFVLLLYTFILRIHVSPHSYTVNREFAYPLEKAICHILYGFLPAILYIHTDNTLHPRAVHVFPINNSKAFKCAHMQHKAIYFSQL